MIISSDQHPMDYPCMRDLDLSTFLVVETTDLSRFGVDLAVVMNLAYGGVLA
jgi:hypothetical protein